MARIPRYSTPLNGVARKELKRIIESQGLTNREVARRLGVDHKTVGNLLNKRQYSISFKLKRSLFKLFPKFEEVLENRHVPEWVPKGYDKINDKLSLFFYAHIINGYCDEESVAKFLKIPLLDIHNFMDGKSVLSVEELARIHLFLGLDKKETGFDYPKELELSQYMVEVHKCRQLCLDSENDLLFKNESAPYAMDAVQLSDLSIIIEEGNKCTKRFYYDTSYNFSQYVKNVKRIRQTPILIILCDTLYAEIDTSTRIICAIKCLYFKGKEKYPNLYKQYFLKEECIYQDHYFCSQLIRSGLFKVFQQIGEKTTWALKDVREQLDFPKPI